MCVWHVRNDKFFDCRNYSLLVLLKALSSDGSVNKRFCNSHGGAWTIQCCYPTAFRVAFAREVISHAQLARCGHLRHESWRPCEMISRSRTRGVYTCTTICTPTRTCTHTHTHTHTHAHAHAHTHTRTTMHNRAKLTVLSSTASARSHSALSASPLNPYVVTPLMSS
jgi:hypothetical protein